MKKIIFLFLLIFATKVSAADKKLEYHLMLNPQNFVENLCYLKDSARDRMIRQVDSDYSYVFYDNYLNIAASGTLPVYDREHAINDPEPAAIESDLPFNSSAVKISILDKSGKEALSINVAQFKNCGDGACDEFENYSICPLDCSSGSFDNYCDAMLDGLCDIDCLDDVSNPDRDCNDLEKAKNKDDVMDFIDNQDAILEQIKNSTTSIYKTRQSDSIASGSMKSLEDKRGLDEKAVVRNLFFAAGFILFGIGLFGIGFWVYEKNKRGKL